MEIALIFNPISGSGRAGREAPPLAESLRRRGFGVRLVETRAGASESWLAPALAGAGGAVVLGGDGAVRMVAAEAARAAVPIWHAPLGTENLFARAFGMDASHERIGRAFSEVAQRGEAWTREIDLGAADGEPFAIMAGFGFDGQVVHDLARVRTGAITHLSYARPILRSLAGFRPVQLAWEIDGEREQLGRGTVFVGNLREYGARLDPTPDAVPDDGLLDATFLPAETVGGLAAWVPLLRLGLHVERLGIQFGARVRRGRRIELTSDSPQCLQLDGDAAGPVAGQRRVSLGLGPNRLRLAVARA